MRLQNKGFGEYGLQTSKYKLELDAQQGYYYITCQTSKKEKMFQAKEFQKLFPQLLPLLYDTKISGLEIDRVIENGLKLLPFL